jgi:hypothetical protein
MSNDAGEPVKVWVWVEAESREARRWAMDKAIRALVAGGFEDLSTPAKPKLSLVKAAS